MSLHAGISVLPHNLLSLISERDHRLMRRVHRWPAPRWIRSVMIGASRAGNGWLWGFLACTLGWVGDAHRFAAIATACLASVASVVIYVVLKRCTGRTRPYLVEPHNWAQVLPPDQYSFPSGHAMTAFAIATALGLFYPALLGMLLPCALLIGISRIMLGMHFLSDVVAGALMGTFLGYAAFVVMA